MSKEPLVSVIMPVYNAEKYLKESIKSILNQTYKNFEFIIIDNASTDSSLEIIKKFSKKDKRIKLYTNKKNYGQTLTVRKGIKLARGKYFFKLDNDDIADKDRLKKIIDFLENNKDYLIVGSNIKIINDKNEVIGLRFYPKTDKEIRTCLFYKSPFAYPAVGIRMNILKKIISFEKETIKFRYCDDYLLWYKILKFGKGYNLKDFLLSYRISDNQIKSKKTKDQLKETIKIQKIIFENEKNIPILAQLNHLLLKLLLLFPTKLILTLFKKVEYKAFKET